MRFTVLPVLFLLNCSHLTKVYLVLYKTAYVVCCLFWLFMWSYLLRNQGKLDNVVLHTDPKSTTLGPQLSFISKFLEKAPFLAQNAYFNYRLEFEKDENTIDNTCPYFLFYEL